MWAPLMIWRENSPTVRLVNKNKLFYFQQYRKKNQEKSEIRGFANTQLVWGCLCIAPFFSELFILTNSGTGTLVFLYYNMVKKSNFNS